MSDITADDIARAFTAYRDWRDRTFEGYEDRPLAEQHVLLAWEVETAAADGESAEKVRALLASLGMDLEAWRKFLAELEETLNHREFQPPDQLAGQAAFIGLSVALLATRQA
jgi:hypothetical protein